MTKVWRAVMEAAGVAPDASTFVQLIDAWSKAKQPERAEGVLGLMEARSVRRCARSQEPFTPV